MRFVVERATGHQFKQIVWQRLRWMELKLATATALGVGRRAEALRTAILALHDLRDARESGGEP